MAVDVAVGAEVAVELGAGEGVGVSGVAPAGAGVGDADWAASLVAVWRATPVAATSVAAATSTARV